MNIVSLKAHLRPSAFFRKISGHKKPSESDQGKVLAVRMVMGKKVTFLKNGERHLNGIKLSEAHDSEILRFCTASLLTNGPIGEKQYCYVNATKNPVEIWLYGKPLKQFLNTVKTSIHTGALSKEFVLDRTIDRKVIL